MALREKVLRKKAEKLEIKGLQKEQFTPERISALNELLHNVYVIRLPNSIDYYYRRDLVRIFNEIAKEIYGKSDDLPVVEEFGSFLMDIFSAKSDLDLSVNFRDKAVEFPREKKIQTLRKFAKKFYPLQRKGHVSSIHPIMTAKVPILKVVDCGTGIECDISVENRDGIVKSQIVRMISSIDERFQKLSFLMKAWAKAHDINSSRDRTLNSLSIISLVAFHLQTRDPPIFPPLSAIFKDGTDPATVSKIVHNFLNYGKRNKESLAELFVTLLIKLASVETLWPKGLCASTYEGSWTSKTWDFKVGCISVEDFTDRSQNVARAVGTAEVKKIYKCIHLSIQYVLAFMDGQIQGPQLREFLFGSDPIRTLVGNGTTDLDKNVAQPVVVLDPIRTKKMRFTEGWGGIKQAVTPDPIHMKKMHSVEGWGATHTKGWGGIHTEGSGGARIGGWEGTHTEGWGGWGGTHTGGWGGTHTEGWGRTQTRSWEETHTKGWGGTQQFAPLDPIQTKMMRSTVGWGRTRQTTPLNPIHAKDNQAAAGWEKSQQANGEISSNGNLFLTPPIPYCTLPLAPRLGNEVSCDPLKLPFILTQNPVGFESSCGALPQPPFLPPHSALAFDGSCSMNRVVPMSYVERMHAEHVRPSHNQNVMHGPPLNRISSGRG